MDNDGLFADPRPARPQPQVADDPDKVPDWMLANLRKALDDLGVTDMADRQSRVVEAAGRPVASLRDLTFTEARQVSEKLAAQKRESSDSRPRSSWDDREGDTWIDRM